jgi:hypothetical protein
MTSEQPPPVRPDFFGQLAATDPYQGRARRLFARGQVVAVNGNQADLRVGYDIHHGALVLKEVPIVSGYVPHIGDWVAIQYEAGHSGAPWVTGPSMAADTSEDPAGIGVFSVSSSAPTDPQKSTIYFDASRQLWRGWDGTEWVDFSAKLHNLLPDLQGGAASEYYHFTMEEHGLLQDFVDAGYLASGYLKWLHFKAIDASGTTRTNLFEKDGDFYWAINATYDQQTDQWNRVDTTKYAYLITLHSENNVPSESVGGVVWWRCTPGANPIGEWTTLGGWELGFMMTQHRSYVIGGMNLEMDGAGSPPYGRLTHIGANDPTGGMTALQRNAWYQGSDSWARDEHTQDSGLIGFDQHADLLVWWYPDSAEGSAPWATADWRRRARLHLGGAPEGVRGRLDVIRSSSVAASAYSAFLTKHKTSTDMADGFGAGYAFAIEDDEGVENVLAALYAVRAGADNTGALAWKVASAGSLDEQMRLTADGGLTVTGHINAGPGGYASEVGEIGADQIGVGIPPQGGYAITTHGGYAIRLSRPDPVDTWAVLVATAYGGGLLFGSVPDGYQWTMMLSKNAAQIGAASGTAANPSFSCFNDWDTGLDFPAADVLRGVVGGLESWRATTGGFGINKAVPAYTLHVGPPLTGSYSLRAEGYGWFTNRVLVSPDGADPDLTLYEGSTSLARWKYDRANNCLALMMVHPSAGIVDPYLQVHYNRLWLEESAVSLSANGELHRNKDLPGLTGRFGDHLHHLAGTIHQDFSTHTLTSAGTLSSLTWDADHRATGRVLTVIASGILRHQSGTPGPSTTVQLKLGSTILAQVTYTHGGDYENNWMGWELVGRIACAGTDSVELFGKGRLQAATTAASDPFPTDGGDGGVVRAFNAPVSLTPGGDQTISVVVTTSGGGGRTITMRQFIAQSQMAV